MEKIDVITMTNKQDENVSPAKTDTTSKSRRSHWMRVVVICLSGGFIFPNAVTEDDDIAKYHYDKEANAKKE
jgi:hypothetical protein